MEYEFAPPSDVPKEGADHVEPSMHDRQPQAFEGATIMDTGIDPGGPLEQGSGSVYEATDIDEGAMDGTNGHGKGRVEMGEDDALRTDFTEMRPAEEVAADEGLSATGDTTFQDDGGGADWGTKITAAARGLAAKLRVGDQPSVEPVSALEQPGPTLEVAGSGETGAEDAAIVEPDFDWAEYAAENPFTVDAEMAEAKLAGADIANAEVIDAEVIDEVTPIFETVEAEIIDAGAHDAPDPSMQPETADDAQFAESTPPAESFAPESPAETDFSPPEVVEEAVLVDDGRAYAESFPAGEAPSTDSGEEIYEAEIIPDAPTEGSDAAPEFAEHAQMEQFEDIPEHRVEEAEPVSEEEYQEILAERNRHLNEEMGDREARFNEAYERWEALHDIYPQAREGEIREDIANLFDKLYQTETPAAEESPSPAEAFEPVAAEASEEPAEPQASSEADAEAPRAPFGEAPPTLTTEQVKRLTDSGIPEKWHNSVSELLDMGLAWEDAVELAEGAMKHLEQHESAEPHESHENIKEFQEHYEQMWKEQIAAGQKPSATEWIIKDESRIAKAAKVIGVLIGANAAGAIFGTFQKFKLRGQPEPIGKPSRLDGQQEFRLTASNGSNVSTVVVRARNAQEAAQQINTSFFTRFQLGKKLN